MNDWVFAVTGKTGSPFTMHTEERLFNTLLFTLSRTPVFSPPVRFCAGYRLRDAEPSVAQNFVSGVIRLTERTIKPGDVLPGGTFEGSAPAAEMDRGDA